MSEPSVMARAGDADFKTTQGYIDLADETFHDEAEAVGARVLGSLVRESEAAAA